METVAVGKAVTGLLLEGVEGFAMRVADSPEEEGLGHSELEEEG